MNQDHEALCRQCGRCCHEKLEIDNMVILTDKPCRFLDRETNLCQIYHDRKRNMRCLSIEEGIAVSAFPADCPYVAEVEGYLAPVELDQLKAGDHIREIVRQLLREECDE